MNGRWEVPLSQKFGLHRAGCGVKTFPIMSVLPGMPRLIVVDDDESVRAMLTLMLDRAGYQVDTANDGIEGLAKLRANKYDLLISDNQMPGLTGLEMIKRLHSERIKLPIIMASGTLLTEDVVDLDIPPLKILNKPYRLADLLALVTTTLAADSGDRVTGNR